MDLSILRLIAILPNLVGIELPYLTCNRNLGFLLFTWICRLDLSILRLIAILPNLVGIELPLCVVVTLS